MKSCPLSHDLMHTIIETLGGRVTKTVITLKAGTYYGSLTIAFQGQEKVSIADPQAPIALAIHFKGVHSCGPGGAERRRHADSRFQTANSVSGFLSGLTLL